MERKLKTDLWKKAYLIEFTNADSGRLLDAFTFSVPPESEEITYSQRKSETKTFGGLHVDDYGLDAVKISLSGSTVNNDLKKIYNPNGASKWMTGEEEIYYLRDMIKKYKSGDYRTQDIKIMLYDLSKMNKGQGAGNGAIKNYWRVFPGDFKIRRSSDRPFTYKYSIEFTAVDEDSIIRKDAKGLGYVKTAIEGIQAAAQWIKGNLSFIDTFTDKIEEGQKYVEGVNVILEEIDSNIRDIANILDPLSNALLGYTSILDNMISNVESIISIPEDVSQKYMNIGLEFTNAALRLVKSTERLTKSVVAWDAVPQEILDEYSTTKEEFKDVFTDKCVEMENSANAIAAESKSNELPTVFVRPMDESETAASGASGGNGFSGTSSASGGNESGSNFGTDGGEAGAARQNTVNYIIILSYGDTEVTLNSTDSLESLATQYLGSPDKALDIAIYNGVASIDELNPGDTIKIPILTPTSRNSLNRIYSRPEDRDNYGRDIYLDDKGDTAASTTGDYQLTGGLNNLNQAILLRLRESVNKRLRLLAYGIRTNVSDPTAGVAYIISSIDLTVRKDPRVSEIENIRFAGMGDGLNVTVDYTDINLNGGSAAGRA